MPTTLRHLGRAALVASVGLGMTTALQAAEWTVVEDTSSVGFTGMQQGTKFTGRFEEFTADIRFDPADPSAGRIAGSVVTDTVETRDHDRDAALVDSDWFDSGAHPEATFVAESIKALDDGTYEATGELTLKGKTNPETMTFTFESGPGNAAKFVGTMEVNRFDYNVGEGWNDTSWVGQDVTVEVSLDLRSGS